MKKDKTQLTNALLSNIPNDIKMEIVEAEDSSPGPSDGVLIGQGEEDFEYIRTNMKYLLETSSEAISNMNALAADSEHPRAYEVLSGMIRNAADISHNLLILHKERKKLIRGEGKLQPKTPQTTNNTVFIGTTNDLKKAMKEAIDV